MFIVNYQIPKRVKEVIKDIDVNTFDLQYHEIHGPIELHFNSKQYGILVDFSFDLPMADELLFCWFELLNGTVVKVLGSEKYVALKLPEIPYSWFEFINQGQSLLVRQVEDTVFVRIPDLIITQPISEFYSKWVKYEAINKQQFVEEVLIKTCGFLEEVFNINPKLLESQFIKHLLDIHKKAFRLAKSRGWAQQIVK